MHNIREHRDKRKKEIAETIRKRIATEPVNGDRHKLSKEDLESNTILNLNLFFDENSTDWPKCKAEIDAVIAMIPTTNLPKGRWPLITSGKKREKRSRYGINLLLANLHDMLNKNKKSIAVSLSPNTYSKTRVGAGFVNQMKLFNDYDLLGMQKGYRNEKDRRKSRIARIWPEDKLKEMMNLKLKTDEILIAKPKYSIELRDTKIRKVGKYLTKKVKHPVKREELPKRLSPDEYEKIVNVDESLCDYFSLVYSDYKITCQKDGRMIQLKPVLVRRYGKDSKHGGRWYMTGPNNYQLMNKEERETVCINGYQTKEYDFGGLHLRILYALAGKSYPKEKDPYKEVLIAMGKDPDKICERFPSIRDDLKEMLLALINEQIMNPKMRDQTALRRANWRLFGYWKDTKDPLKKMEAEYECNERKNTWQKAGILNPKTKAKDVLRAFYKAHKQIKHYFNGGCKYDLLNVDSEIADYVLREMMFGDYPIPTLSLHDSFRTFREYKYSNKLKTAMRECYQYIMRRITGREKAIFPIPVKPVIVKNQL